MDTLKRQFDKGMKYFRMHPEEVKTTELWARFMREVVAPLSLILLEEARAAESPEDSGRIATVCLVFSGRIVRYGQETGQNKP